MIKLRNMQQKTKQYTETPKQESAKVTDVVALGAGLGNLKALNNLTLNFASTGSRLFAV